MEGKGGILEREIFSLYIAPRKNAVSPLRTQLSFIYDGGRVVWSASWLEPLWRAKEESKGTFIVLSLSTRFSNRAQILTNGQAVTVSSSDIPLTHIVLLLVERFPST